VTSFAHRVTSFARRVRDWLRRRTPTQILVVGLVLFWIYCWPGFVGWDTRAHLLDARAGHYTDGHPPAVAYLVRICELFVAGPVLLMLIQSITLMLGLYMLLKTRIVERAAAWLAVAIFLFPPISGVTALVAKDGLMAGGLMIGIALLADEDTRRHRLALVFIFFASLMRWNALAATFVPMILLFRWKPALPRLKRYAIAGVAWLAVTGAAYETNELLTDETEYFWYWSNAYQDIAGTLEYMPDLDDATLTKLLDGVPLVEHENIHAKLRAIYNPAHIYHLMRDKGRVFRIAETQAERDAIAAAWKRIVLGNPGGYFRYRLDNFRLLLNLERRPSFSNVYIWFTVLAAPDTIAELEHDAYPSRIQAKLRAWSQWISLTPLYWLFPYFGLCFLMLPLCWRKPVEGSLLLSAIGYELAWFFLAQTTDYRYSQWMLVCTLSTLTLIVARRRVAA
jgi:hypothetical protein